ncbi:hypothetical protein BDZ45DRAFT_674551 [Acephala macrosclerotiorum]|nr:hypothetical protein BDZ45DRAFT_674551 [Acephala macrosclerotiorum]
MQALPPNNLMCLPNSTIVPSKLNHPNDLLFIPFVFTSLPLFYITHSQLCLDSS